MILHFSLVAIVEAVNYTQITFNNYSLFHYPIFRYVVLFIKCFGISEMGFIHCTFQYTNISLFYNVKLLSVLEIKDQKNFYFGHILLVFSLGHYHTQSDQILIRYKITQNPTFLMLLRLQIAHLFIVQQTVLQDRQFLAVSTTLTRNIWAILY